MRHVEMVAAVAILALAAALVTWAPAAILSTLRAWWG